MMILLVDCEYCRVAQRGVGNLATLYCFLSSPSWIPSELSVAKCGSAGEPAHNSCGLLAVFRIYFLSCFFLYRCWVCLLSGVQVGIWFMFVKVYLSIFLRLLGLVKARRLSGQQRGGGPPFCRRLFFCVLGFLLGV